MDKIRYDLLDRHGNVLGRGLKYPWDREMRYSLPFLEFCRWSAGGRRWSVVTEPVTVMLCSKCGHRLITASAEVGSFDVDGEPYEAGVEEECGHDIVEEYISIVILWCPQCGETRRATVTEGPACGVNYNY